MNFTIMKTNRNAFTGAVAAALLFLFTALLAHAAPWGGLTDRSTNLLTSAFSFTGAFSAAGDSNENYYDGDMGDFDGDGWMDRARPVAIEMIGRLAKHDQERAVTTLLPLLQHDPEWRSVEAAGAALARIDDARAVDPIRATSQTHRDPELREKAKAWLEEMEKK